jgi:hypothetical protein
MGMWESKRHYTPNTKHHSTGIHTHTHTHTDLCAPDLPLHQAIASPAHTPRRLSQCCVCVCVYVCEREYIDINTLMRENIHTHTTHLIRMYICMRNAFECGVCVCVSCGGDLNASTSVCVPTQVEWCVYTYTYEHIYSYTRSYTHNFSRAQV